MQDGVQVWHNFVSPEFIGCSGDGPMLFGEVLRSEDAPRCLRREQKLSTLHLLDPFENTGSSLASANTHGHHSITSVAAAHLVQDGGGQLRARAAQWMTECDRAAVHVHNPR